jgi:hypothetical protein
MRAYFAEENRYKQDEIALRQITGGIDCQCVHTVFEVDLSNKNIFARDRHLLTQVESDDM